MDKKEYDSFEYRKLCRDMFIPILQDLKRYLNEDYIFYGIIGINESPTCSIEGSRGIFMEEIFNILDKEGIKTKYTEIPTNYHENKDYDELYSNIRKDLDLI